MFCGWDKESRLRKMIWIAAYFFKLSKLKMCKQKNEKFKIVALFH